MPGNSSRNDGVFSFSVRRPAFSVKLRCSVQLSWAQKLQLFECTAPSLTTLRVTR
jgi:hypothetical protein